MIKFVDLSKIIGGVTTEKFPNLLLDQRSILEQVVCEQNKMTPTSFVSGKIHMIIRITRALEMKIGLLSSAQDSLKRQAFVTFFFVQRYDDNTVKRTFVKRFGPPFNS